jgi:DNA methylase
MSKSPSTLPSATTPITTSAVNKGSWDKSRGPNGNYEFNLQWLAACQCVLKPNGSIWVSGTSHVIHSVGFAMQQLGFKFLNDISWVKPNPPPNLSCRYFTHATENIIWAAKNSTSRHRLCPTQLSPPTRPVRAPLLLHRPPQARSYLHCPRRPPSTTPAKNSALPAAPTPTPASSSKPKLKSTSPKGIDWNS